MLMGMDYGLGIRIAIGLSIS